MPGGEKSKRKFDHDAARAMRAEGATLQQVAERFGVTRERIRQITVPGFARDETHVTNGGAT